MALALSIVFILNLLSLTTASTPAPFHALAPFHPLNKRQAQSSICQILPDVGTRIGESTCGSGVVYTSANCICCSDGFTPCHSILQSCQCSGGACACVDKYNLSGDCASQGLASCGSKCMPRGQVCCNSNSYCPAGYECCNQGGVMNCCPTSSSGSAASSVGGSAAVTTSPANGKTSTGQPGTTGTGVGTGSSAKTGSAASSGGGSPAVTTLPAGSSSNTASDGRKNVPLFAEVGIGLIWWLF